MAREKNFHSNTMRDLSTEIKKIEDLSLNAWPSHQIQVYDGWILRFSYFYTHRTNCVEQIGISCLPLEEKISECERVYRRWGTPCIFKISPLGDPDLDGRLAARGYRIEHPVNVMTRDLTEAPAPGDVPEGLRVGDRVSEDWISALFRMKQVTDPDHLRVVPQMYAAIPKDEIAVSLTDEDSVIRATGLGILDRNVVGIYAIHVDPPLRRRGIASAIVGTILDEAFRGGARSAYLQAVSDNMPARTLYRRLGFSDLYRCWFRVKEV